MKSSKLSGRKNFLDQEIEFQGKYSNSVMETLWLAYKPFKNKMLFCVLLGLFGRIMLLANANVIGLWVDSLVSKNKTLPPETYLQILLTLSGLGFLMTLVFRTGFSRLSARAVSRIYDEVTLRTSRFPMQFFDSTPTGRIITRFSSDYGNVFRLFGGPLAEFLAIIFDLIAMVILITFASPYYLPIVCLIGILNFIVYKRNRQNLRNTRRNLSSSRSPSIAHFAETAQGASTIRSFNKEKSFADRFYRLDSDYLDQKLKTTRELLKYSFKMNSLTALLFLIIGVTAYYWVQKGYVTIGSIGVAFSFIALSGSTVQMFFEWMAQFEEAMVGIERLDNYIRKPLEKGAKLPSSSQFNTLHPQYSADEEVEVQMKTLTSAPNAHVSFKNVWFRYRETLPFVLKGLNLEIKAGERFGIIGRTGSGKSSLIQSLFSLYPLSEGQIQVAGQSPETIDLEIYRKSMAFISQDSILFKGCLLDNLDIDRKFSQTTLFSVLNRVGLEEFASEEGLQTKIEERGRNLSAGEKQLICMARCLLQNTPVVIMDEATSSVDPQSEEILERATEDLFTGRTQIIIAHRFSTLKNCHRILWLDDGMAKMIGTPEEILPSFEQQ